MCQYFLASGTKHNRLHFCIGFHTFGASFSNDLIFFFPVAEMSARGLSPGVRAACHKATQPLAATHGGTTQFFSMIL